MKFNDSIIRAALEITYQKQSAQPREQKGWSQRFSHYRRRVGHQCLRFLVGSREPKITPRRDRNGNPYYEIYDPISGDRCSCATEQEVRVWLEQRYAR